jgi:uncharacterized membrane protein
MKTTNEKSSVMLRFLTRAAIIGALYAALTLILLPFAFGAVQFRVSEAMTVLPLFFPEAIPGLFVGCIISNIMTPNIPVLDVVFGSLATLAAAYLTSWLRSSHGIKRAILAPLPPVIINAVVVGAIITFSSVQPGESFFKLFISYALSVGAGEAAVCYLLGIPLMMIVDRLQIRLKSRSNIEQ